MTKANSLPATHKNCNSYIYKFQTLNISAQKLTHQSQVQGNKNTWAVLLWKREKRKVFCWYIHNFDNMLCNFIFHLHREEYNMSFHQCLFLLHELPTLNYAVCTCHLRTSHSSVGMDYGYGPWVRVRNHAYGYELGFGYKTMGMVMGKVQHVAKSWVRV